MGFYEKLKEQRDSMQNVKNVADALNMETIAKEKTTQYIYDAKSISPDDKVSKEFFKKYKLAIPYNYFDSKKLSLLRFDFWGFKQRRIYNKQLTTAYCIRMELKNGYHRTFVVIDDGKDGFFFMDKKFIFDRDALYYDIDLKIWCYDYHEDFVLPIKRTIPITELKDAVMEKLEKRSGENSKLIAQVKYAINPRTVYKWLTSNVIEAMLQGGLLYKILIIIAIMVGADIVINLVGHGLGDYWTYKTLKMDEFITKGVEQITTFLSSKGA